jgi:hypothetical protein
MTQEKIMIDDKIARVKTLIQKRDEIDAELASIFGGPELPRRGRPRTKTAGPADGETMLADVLDQVLKGA